MPFKCNECGIELDTESGWKRHQTRVHKAAYGPDELRAAGIEPGGRDIARSLDSGNTSINDVVANAPETEQDAKTQTASGKRAASKEAKERAADLEEFRRLRPMLVAKWKRRLRIPYSFWARVADDPSIALSEEELNEGAEMHVDFCEAMGWLKAGKIEAIMDLTLWHGGTILSRSQLGQELMREKSAETSTK